jgi:hypothetical protein
VACDWPRVQAGVLWSANRYRTRVLGLATCAGGCVVVSEQVQDTWLVTGHVCSPVCCAHALGPPPPSQLLTDVFLLCLHVNAMTTA